MIVMASGIDQLMSKYKYPTDADIGFQACGTLAGFRRSAGNYISRQARLHFF
jgi:hypothetical protein